MRGWTSVALLALVGCTNGGVNIDDLIDQDGDGFFVNDPTAGRADCDDRPTVGLNAFPGGLEVCDGLDNDCNGATDEDSAEGALEWWPDDDKDGFGKFTNEPKLACTVPDGYSANRRDCNDADDAVYPNAPERCNGVDDNCNLINDEGFNPDANWHVDADRDGYGSQELAGTGCAVDPSWVENKDDCNDVNRRINPEADEICDGVDNNCNGLADDADTQSELVGARRWYHDVDADTYGNVIDAKLACLQPQPANEWVVNSDDCNDADPKQNPTTVWYVDADRDGHGSRRATWVNAQCWQPIGFSLTTDDCDDADASEWKDRPWYADDDRDGYGSTQVVWTGCGHNALWSDNALDCADRDSARNPANVEVCNGIDDDCDGLIDDADAIVSGRTVWYRDNDADGYGVFFDRVEACAKPDGYAALSGDCDDSDPLRNGGTVWYVDADRDGYGDPADPAPVASCALVAGHVTNPDDCDDSDFFLNDYSLWFTDGDGDGVGTGIVPVDQGCLNQPEGLAPKSGDCNDSDPQDNAGGCFGPRQGLVTLTIHADAEPFQTSVTLTCDGLPNPVLRNLLPADANKDLVIKTAAMAAGSTCTLRIAGDVLDLSGDGYTVVDVTACNDVVGSLELAPTSSTLPAFTVPNCAGCTDPLALNYDPSVLIANNALACIYAP